MRVEARQARRLITAGLCGVAVADLSTGAFWFGPAYLLIIAGAAWCLGWRPAVLIGFACLAIGVAANGLLLYPYGGIAAAWNMAMRILVVVAVIVLATNLRAAYEAEWRLARTDQLTGALSRKGFFELTSGVREHQGWTLLAYGDLDGLKKINDTRGHRAGDEALRLFSRQVLGMIRKDDTFARLGGDEFAIYMQVKDEVAAKEVAARLHSGMNCVEGAHQLLRCSLGALILRPGARGIDLELCAADELMYEAKNIGASLVAATAVVRDGEIRILERHADLAPQQKGENGQRQPKVTAVGNPAQFKPHAA
ncbi:MAG: GGDEF domain-containing protein [Novosphingobium sp.]|nr:GGDEF domain-containing protein [Novosphingobium sp.]